MKYVGFFARAAFCFAALFAAVAEDGSLRAAGNEPSGNLTVWSYTGEIQTMLEAYYVPQRDSLDIEYRQIAADQFPSAVDRQFATGSSTPDVMTLEEAFLRRYVESGNLLDITDVADSIRGRSFAYPIEMATYEGRVYALSWQVTPGAMFYRRSLAKKYLGTDDPAEVQRYFSDFDTFLDTARVLKEKSGGTCFAVASYQDLMHPFEGMKAKPWIGAEGLEIDEAMTRFMDLSKTMRREGLDLNLEQWSDLWFAGMKDRLQNRQGGRLDVFSYFFPPWGLFYVLKTNAPDTSGDWGIIQGPSSWSWGGSWIAASKATANPEAAKDLIRFLVSDDQANEGWARKTGDLVTNTGVIARVKDSYAEPFVRGQNHYAAFAEFARSVTGVGLQATDTQVESYFYDAVARYRDGEMGRDEALRYFIDRVGDELGVDYAGSGAGL